MKHGSEGEASQPDGQSLASRAEVALRRAAKKAILEAQRTGTPVVVWENGRVVEIPSSRFRVEGETIEILGGNR